MKWYAALDADGRLLSEPVDFPWPGWQEVPGPLPDTGWACTEEFRVEDCALVHDPTAEQAADAASVVGAEAYASSAYDVSCDTDRALCDAYEALLGAQETIAEQDAAICELYELVTGGQDD